MRMASLALVSVSKGMVGHFMRPSPCLNPIDSDPFQSLPNILGATFPAKSVCPHCLLFVARRSYLQERTNITR